MNVILSLLPWLLPTVIAVVAITQGNWLVAIGAFVVFGVLYGFISFREKIAEKAAEDRKKRLGE